MSVIVAIGGQACFSLARARVPPCVLGHQPIIALPYLSAMTKTYLMTGFVEKVYKINRVPRFHMS